MSPVRPLCLPYPRPPRAARWLLRRPMWGAAGEVIAGDLEEKYAGEALPRLGRIRACLWFWAQALYSTLACLRLHLISALTTQRGDGTMRALLQALRAMPTTRPTRRRPAKDADLRPALHYFLSHLIQPLDVLRNRHGQLDADEIRAVDAACESITRLKELVEGLPDGRVSPLDPPRGSPPVLGIPSGDPSEGKPEPEATQDPDPGSQGMAPELFERVVVVVDQNLGDEDFNVEALARRLAMSRSVLYRRMKGVTGQTPARLILRRRLQRAAGMLGNGSQQCADVAHAVGFKSVSHFSYCFRDQYGMSPSAFRRHEKGKALFDLLDERGFALPEDARRRILACRDVARLERWCRRARAVERVEELWDAGT